MNKQLLLIAALPSCGGNGSYSSSSQAENGSRNLPSVEQLFGGYRLDAIGVDFSCVNTWNLECRVEPRNRNHDFADQIMGTRRVMSD